MHVIIEGETWIKVGMEMEGSEVDGLNRREYFREKQQQHRNRMKSEIVQLNGELTTLQLQLKELQTEIPPMEVEPTTELALSWRIVASTFRQESTKALAEKMDLESQTQENQQCINEMQKFISSYQTLPGASSWSQMYRFASLPSNAQARHEAKIWLTQQMYHSLDQVYEFVEKVDPTAYFNHADVEFDGPYMNLLEHAQHVISKPIRSIIKVFRDHNDILLDIDMSDLTIEVSGNTKFYRHKDQNDPSWNLLHAFFHEADRCVMVYRRIQQDALDPNLEIRQRHAMEWLDIRRLSDSQTSIRSFMVVSQYYTNDGFMNLKDIARHCGHISNPHDLGDEELKQYIRDYFITRCKENTVKNMNRILEVLATIPDS